MPNLLPSAFFVIEPSHDKKNVVGYNIIGGGFGHGVGMSQNGATLEAYGINKEAFFEKMDKMADDALASGSPGNTIKEVTKEDILHMYKKLWEA